MTDGRMRFAFHAAMRTHSAIAMLIAAFVLVGCGLKKMTTRTVGAISFDGAVLLESERDVDIARDSTIPLIKSLEVFSAGDPHDCRYLALLAKSYGQYAFAFFEEDMIRYRGRDDARARQSEERADWFYGRGKDYGLKALATKGATKKAIEATVAEFERALGAWGRADVPVLFWTAFAWGNWINLHRDDPAVFVDTPRVQALAERAVALDPAYSYGGALALLGALHASRPPMLGGDYAKARDYFDRAVATEPRYLMNKVMAAQHLAVQCKDRGMFERLLREVLAADAAVLPEQRLANELAKRRAALLMERIEEYF